MKKLLAALLAMFICLLPAIAETMQTDSEIKDLYELIEMSFTKAELDEIYECAETEEGYFLYENEILCAFYESGRLQAKVRAFESAGDIAPVASISLNKLSSYKQGMTIEKVIEAFGNEGLEIMKINLADEENAGVRRVLVWKTEAGNVVQALFELDDNEWVLFAIAEVKQ